MSVRESCDRDHHPGRSGGAAVAEDPRLDDGTQLVGLRWYPDAGEASAFLVTGGRDLDQEREDLAVNGPRSPEERARMDADNRARTGRRARGRLRRYVVANGLSRMASLTYAPTVGSSSPDCGQTEAPKAPMTEAVHQAGDDGRCTVCGRPYGPEGLSAVMRDAAGAVRRLRAILRVERLPYALVPEYHADGHVHAHVLLGRYVAKAVLERAWVHGWVDVRRFQGRGGREAARKAAAYAGKYVAKAVERDSNGRHRYEVGQGFQPSVVKRSGYRSLEAAVDFVLDHGQRVVYGIHSDAIQGYDGPAFLYVSLEAST